ncbi:MAG: MoxR family ATPase [Deltaproteobacteria bacterium]|nr:MoxR family ATPase [Deltaproteobacteria bacterium]
MSIDTAKSFSDILNSELKKAVVGHDLLIEELMVALLSGGHMLIEGPPGTGKTLIVRTLAECLDLVWGRIQFTPDLMPSDITGTYIFDQNKKTWSFRKGPVFVNVLLADELNRAPAKTQAALLEAMEEGAVTLDGRKHDLPKPFLVMATQNPMEHEGTYPLPESELDRFMFKSIVSDLAKANEIEMLKRHRDGFDPARLGVTAGIHRSVDASGFIRAAAAAEEARVDDSILEYIVNLVQKTRAWPDLFHGAGPRAGVHLLRSSRTLAALKGYPFVIPDHVKRMCYPVLRHRLALSPEQEMEGLNTDAVIAGLLETVEVPRKTVEAGSGSGSEKIEGLTIE